MSSVVKGSLIGAFVGIALILLHPFGSYAAEEILGICAVLFGASVGAGYDR